jgi:hypothetical protein
MDPDTKEIKKRVVLDMSRHINNLLVPTTGGAAGRLEGHRGTKKPR